MRQAPIAQGPLSIELKGPFLRVPLGAPHKVLSFAPIRGGFQEASEVLWLRLFESDLKPPVVPRDFYMAKARQLGMSENAVGMMTSADISHYRVVTRSFGGESATCVVTAGLSNRRRIGDLPGPSGRIRKSYGTINILLVTSCFLTEKGMLEAFSLMAEARTLAMVEVGLKSPISHLPATGTGTDCLCLAAPRGAKGQSYAGKHTKIGHVIGEATYLAVKQAASFWVEYYGIKGEG